MFQYHCLNPIAGVGLANFNENYQQSESLEGADAVLVRSAAMHLSLIHISEPTRPY